MFEMPAASLLSLFPTLPAGGSAMLIGLPTGNGTEQAETGGFAQVLALLPLASTKPAPGLEATAPEAGIGLLPSVPTAILPESGKILPGSLPVAKSQTSPHSIPAGIVAMLPQSDAPSAVPAPASTPSARLAAIPQAKPSLTGKALPEGSASQQEEPTTSDPEVVSPPAEPNNSLRARLPLHRVQVAPATRKLAHTPAKANEPPLRDEPLAEVAVVVTGIRATLAPEIPATAATMPQPAETPPARQVIAKARRTDTALPTTTAGVQLAPISPAIAPLPEAVLRQPGSANQQAVQPSAPQHANPQQRTDAPKITLPVADIASARAQLLPVVSLAIEPEPSLPVSLTITTPLRTPLPHRGEVLAAGPHNGSILPFTHTFALSKPVQAEPLPAQPLPNEAAAPTAQSIPTPTGSSPFTAPDLSASPAVSTERPADFTQIIDRLIAARDVAGAGQSQPVHVSLSHAEFGKVSLRFTHDDGALLVALSSADPGFARAAQIAAPAQSQVASADSNSSSQPQPRSGDSPAFASNSQPQSGSNGNSGQRQTAPEFRSARGEPARQPNNADDETTPDRRHRFA